jgi:thymidylate kinase
MKRNIIIFEGISKTGKTTLKDYLREVSDHEFITIDRFSASMYAHGAMHMYDGNIDKWLQIDERLKDCAIYVYMTASRGTLAFRGVRYNYWCNYDMITKKYEKYFNKTPIPVIRIDSSENNIIKCCEILLKEMERI